MSTSVHSAVHEHVEKRIGRIHRAYDEFVVDDLRLHILHVKSSLFRPYETLVTAGMSELPMTVPEGIRQPSRAEIVALLPKGWPLSREALQDEENFWPIQMLVWIVPRCRLEKLHSGCGGHRRRCCGRRFRSTSKSFCTRRNTEPMHCSMPSIA
jgi:hypothetical protein